MGAPSFTLMGDAIHLMPPFGAYGGNPAFRDAALLGQVLEEAAHGLVPIENAFTSYQKLMLEYSSGEVRSAQRMMTMTSGPFADSCC
jgi:2-polyprenyl-6-methoxyphenol hydroxylase-like FAD-dependent oxidoreductase